MKRHILVSEKSAAISAIAQALDFPDWFGQNLPQVRTRLIQPRQSWVDDAEMRAQVAREGDGAILGVGL